MSERIYAFLLRLYPSHFRLVYGDEALQLVRDRARHESPMRLWIDLLFDLVRALPRLHLHPAPIATRATAPAFLVLDSDAPRAASLFLGVVASLFLIFATIPIGHVLARGPAGSLRPRTAMQVAAQAPPQFTAADRHRLIQAAAANVKRYYFDKQVAETTASALLAHEQAGDYDAAAGQVFANLLARHLTEASRDRHFTMEYTARVFPDFSKPPPPQDQARYRAAMLEVNCAFEKVEIGMNHVGYVKLNAFPDIAACQEKAESAMAAVNHADALIFDLRDNRGGFPNMVVFLASYLFDHPEYMFNPKDPVTEQTWTRSPVAGSLLVDKPVYVLTSSRTYSGAEQFSYDLKMLKRATLVGETTGGASHSGVLHNLDDHFAIGIPEHKPVNPFSGKDWAVTGVEPDVKVKAADALATAEKLAETRLRRR
ncbi:MAG TPA: S41 family peptidase [Bryobacteraceae bacterium]|nr:S41 family peptidase [Bryobacteraceae bacterium]